MRWIAVVLVACNGPSGRAERTDGSGTDPSSGTTRSTSAPATSSGLVWVDAAGDVVPGILQIGVLTYTDSNGNGWTLDPWAETSEDAFGAYAVPSILYGSSDCTEPWISSHIPTPRFVLSVSGDGRRAGASTSTNEGQTTGTVSFYVVPDDAQIESKASGYHGPSAANCERVGTLEGIPVSQLEAVQRPELSWLPPVHHELR